MLRRSLLLCLCVACAGPQESPDTAVSEDQAGCDPRAPVLPEELGVAGPCGVGFSFGEVRYADSVSGAERSLRLAVYYPSAVDTSAALLPYNSALFLPVLDPPLGAGIEEGAPLAPGPLPVFVYSHGLANDSLNASRLAAHFASHGWVFVAPDHPGSSLYYDDDRQTETYLQLPGDLSATLDHLLSGDEPTLLDAVDPEALVVGGYSYGAYGVWALSGLPFDVDGMVSSCAGSDADRCSNLSEANLAAFETGFSEPRAAALVAMAGGDTALFSLDEPATLSAPMLLFTATGDEARDGEDRAYWPPIAGGENRWVEVSGGTHGAWHDFGLGQTFTEPDPETFHRIQFSYLLGFARLHGLGDLDQRGVVDGDTALSPYASVTR